MCRRDRLGCTLVRVNAAEKQQIFATMRVEGKVLERDAMMDRCCIAQVRMAIGIADSDIVDAFFIFLESRQDALRRETVDGRHYRGSDQPREGERYEIGLVVNKVELTSLLEDMGDMEHLPH